MSPAELPPNGYPQDQYDAKYESGNYGDDAMKVKKSFQLSISSTLAKKLFGSANGFNFITIRNNRAKST